MRHATIIELAGEAPAPSCAWPIGDPGEPTFRFCGAPRDGNATALLACYCAAHGRAAMWGHRPNPDTLERRLFKYLDYLERVRSGVHD